MARKLYGSVKYLDDFTACRIEEQSSTPAAVTSVNSSTLATWAKTRTNFTTAIGSGKELDYILVDLYPLGGSYHCDFGFAFEDGTNVSDRMFSDSTISGLAATVLSETGVTISDSITTLQASLIYPTATYTHESKEIVKLYGAVSGPVYQAEQPTMIEDTGAGQFINQSQFDLDKLGAYFKSINCQIGVDYRMTLWGTGTAGLWIGDPNSQTMDMKNSITVEELATLGISATTGLYTATGNVSFRVRVQQNGTETLSKEIKKFYGSAEVPAYVSSQPQMTADQGMGQYIDQSAFDLNKLGDAIAAGGGQTGTYYQMNIWYTTSQGGFGIWVGNPGTIIMQTGLSRAALAEYGVTTNATPSTDTGNAEFRVSIQQNGTKSVTKLLLDNS